MKPQPFGRFLLLDKVASGGMAEVFRAKLSGESGFQRIVAIKKILPHVCEDQDFITMFTDEAKITVQLQHSNIGQVYEFDKIDGLFYIAMEYISGKDLKTIWSYQRSRKAALPLDFCCYIVQKMAEGLDYAHRKKDNFGNDLGIVHRDVSPQNCLISWDGEVKVIDFGIAKAAEKGGRTRAGTLKGKFAYMSPEQIRGLGLDGRADVFALGVVLYELVTGERGFQAESEFSLLEMVRNVEIKPPTMVNREIPQELERIIFKALAKDREHRYRWGSDLAEDLQRFLLSKGSPPKPADVGKYLRENFTVDYDKERLRLESYKEIEWNPQKHAAQQAAAAAAAQPPTGSDLPPAPPPASLTAVQAAMLDESVGGESAFASAEDSAFASSSGPHTSTGVRASAPPAATSTGYVIGGYREEVTAGRTPTNSGFAPSMQVTLPGTSMPNAPAPVAASGGGFLKKILLAGVVLLLLAAAVAGALFFALQKTGTLTVTVSGPPDAEVMVDGEVLGVASPSLTLSSLPAGTHDLIIQKPNSTYQAYHQQVTVTAGKVASITAEMQQAPGRFNVSSSPMGVRVLLDGEEVCEKTPCQVPATGGVIHQLMGKKKGFKDALLKLKVEPSQTLDTELQLKPEVIVVEVKTIPAEAELRINGKKLGVTPLQFEHDPELGVYPKAKLTKRGCKPYETTVPVGDNEQKQTFTFELECK